MPALRWRSRDGASAIATLQGAHLVSWIPAGGEECLFVSERSPFAAGRPIRGGIPVCYPQFAELGPLMKHGFARHLPWAFTGAAESEDGTRVSFVFEDSPQTQALWPHSFRLILTATIGGASLDVQLEVANTGTAAFDFAGALHTYLRISDEAAVRLAGLRGTRYRDREGSLTGVEARELVTAREPIDRAYFAAPTELQLEDAGRVFRIRQRGFADTVVWNPGRDLTAQMVDMPADGYKRMFCVEAAALEPPVVVEPGATWVGGQTIVAPA